jgi:hypothetical protein
LERVLGVDEQVESLSWCGPIGGIAAVTNARFLQVQPQASRSEQPKLTEFTWDELHSIATKELPNPYGYESSLAVAPLVMGQPCEPLMFDGPGGLSSGQRIVDAARGHLTHAPTHAWYDDPKLNLLVRLDSVTVLVTPEDGAVPPKSKAFLRVANTGIQVFQTRLPQGVKPRNAAWEDVPWSLVLNVEVQGLDQVQLRPSVGAVFLFGVLGLAARKREKNSYLVVETTKGEYVFEVSGLLPSELRGMLSPALSRRSNAEEPAPQDQAQDSSLNQGSILEQIKQLGELRDRGYVSAEEFEKKKIELLERL